MLMTPRQGVAVQNDLKLIHEAVVVFDEDFSQKYGVQEGFLTNDDEGESYAPVAMWLEALELVIERLQNRGLELSRVRGISATAAQHATVFWNHNAERLLQRMEASGGSLIDQLAEDDSNAFSHPFSPNSQDRSTQTQRAAFNEHFGDFGEKKHAEYTGSKAYFVGGFSSCWCATP